ncbi:MAG: hypothetical protein JWP57_4191 [Spirosoma sp.]|nr:hypothetical protein [Spirosoma sp.]
MLFNAIVWSSSGSKSKLLLVSSLLGLSCLPMGASAQQQIVGANAQQQIGVSSNNGDALTVPYHIKIEHRGHSPIDVLIHQLGTREGRTVLAFIAAAIGVDPQTATEVATVVPLPSINEAETDNYPFYHAPVGMTICKAGPIGTIETSHSSWSARIVRDTNNNGLGMYVSVGTSPGQTHRSEGSFFIEFVKAEGDWEKKYQCTPTGTLVWNQRG